MKEQLKTKSAVLISLRDELIELWQDYVKLEGEVSLGGSYFSMWDGSGERMDKLTYHDGVVFIVDVFGLEYDFKTFASFECLHELYDIILAKKAFEEYE